MGLFYNAEKYFHAFLSNTSAKTQKSQVTRQQEKYNGNSQDRTTNGHAGPSINTAQEGMG